MDDTFRVVPLPCCPNIPDAPVPVLGAATIMVVELDAGSVATAAVAAATERVLPLLSSSASNDARPAIIIALSRGVRRFRVAWEMKLLVR